MSTVTFVPTQDRKTELTSASGVGLELRGPITIKHPGPVERFEVYLTHPDQPHPRYGTPDHGFIGILGVHRGHDESPHTRGWTVDDDILIPAPRNASHTRQRALEALIKALEIWARAQPRATA